jgi:hypothetical protein
MRGEKLFAVVNICGAVAALLAWQNGGQTEREQRHSHAQDTPEHTDEIIH